MSVRLLSRAAVVLALGVIGLSASPLRAESAQSTAQTLEHAEELIDQLQLAEAERVLAELEATDSAFVLWARGQLAFYRGDYASAATLTAQAIDGAKSARVPKHWRSLHELIVATRDAMQGYEREKSADGRYIIEFPEGKDRILVPYALDALARMDRALASALGRELPGPIRLEIYPSAESLAAVSTLTAEQIETSGTVALCKWNRLMVTSPRALVRGYPWLDTIAHELTHLYVSYVTAEKAPVWLQEGTAKLLEHRWRDAAAPYSLDPASRGLLERATRDGKLLTFEQLHPSIALLPSQEDASLAFAQVSTFMDDFVTTRGEPALRDAFARIAQGKDARDALASAAGVAFSALEKSWKSKLPKAAPEAPAPRKLERRWKRGRDAPDDSAEVTQTEAKRFLRIGDMLWSQRRVRAAAIEYDKAHRADPDDPIVAARLARAALEDGDPARSLSAVERLVLRYPEHAPTHAVRGAALAALGRADEARSALQHAIAINPFDPEPHCALAGLPEAAGPSRVDDERSACELLGGALAQKSR